MKHYFSDLAYLFCGMMPHKVYIIMLYKGDFPKKSTCFLSVVVFASNGEPEKRYALVPKLRLIRENEAVPLYQSSYMRVWMGYNDW